MADHGAGPRNIANPEIDISNLCAFPSLEHLGNLVMVMNVCPFLPSSAMAFSDAIDYRIRLRPVRVVLSPYPTEALTPAPRIPAADQHQALVYVASLGSEASRRTMRQALEVIAQFVSSGRQDVLALPWHELRFQHTQAIRTALIDRGYSPANGDMALNAQAARSCTCRSWRRRP